MPNNSMWPRRKCKKIPRPCPFARCRWHMIWMRHNPTREHDIRGFMSKSVGTIANEIVEMPPDKSCVLDMSDYPHTLDEIGQAVGITRERVRQIQDGAGKRNRGGAIGKLRHATRSHYLEPFMGEGKRRGLDVRTDDRDFDLWAEG